MTCGKLVENLGDAIRIPRVFGGNREKKEKKRGKRKAQTQEKSQD
jgi:hypothetical protein